MSDENPNKTMYEELLIQYIFNDSDVREKILPYLNPDVFSSYIHSQIIKEAQEFMEKYQTFPKVSELKISINREDVYNKLISIMNIDSSQYGKEFILSELEEFYRKSLLCNVIMDASETMDKDSCNFSDYPDKMREALAFSFSNEIGTSFVEDCDKIYDALHNKDSVISTGIKALDNYTDGGAHEKSLNLIMGGTNIGKSLILCGMSVNFLLQNKNVLYISLEMSEEKITERILANMFDIDLNQLKMIDKKTFIRKHASVVNGLKSNFVTIQYGAKTINSNRIRSILKELKIKKNFVPDVLVVDYLGLMTTNNKTKDSNSYSEMKSISEELRSVAVEENLIVWSAVQTNRNGIKSAELDLTDIADSIGTAATADLIIGVSITDEMREAGRYIWMLLKNRYGLNQQKMYVGVCFPKMRVYDIDDDEDDKIMQKPTNNLVDDAAITAISTIRNNSRARINNAVGIE
jgi:replicative DNA helicase